MFKVIVAAQHSYSNPQLALQAPIRMDMELEHRHWGGVEGAVAATIELSPLPMQEVLFGCRPLMSTRSLSVRVDERRHC